MDAKLRSTLSDRLAAVRARVADAARRAGRDPAGVTLVAVTKTVSADVARVAAELGATDLGENRPQELWRKAAAVPAARWHLVGHLHVVAAKLAAQLGLADGYRLVINCNEGAGQTVPHLHMHLLGGRPFTWPPG